MIKAPIDHIRPLPQLVKPNPVDQAVFDMIDGDGNGKLSADEWKQSGWTADRLEAFDADRDGTVTRSEFNEARRFEREFNDKDRNGDGNLSRFEINGWQPIYRKGFAQVQTGIAKAVGGAKDLVAKCMPFPPFQQADQFSRYDDNRDGKVDKAEYIKGRREDTHLIRPIPFYKNEPILKNPEAPKPKFDLEHVRPNPGHPETPILQKPGQKIDFSNARPTEKKAQ